MKHSTTTRREIEIIGGGLAGLSLGLALRRSGVAVTIHEAGSYPRHRVCGEFITGLAATTIERLGLGRILSDALLHREVAWQISDREPQIQQLPAAALGISRYRLDARLAEEFVRAGGDLHSHSRRSDESDAPGRVFATGRRRQTSSPWIGLKIHARNLALTRDLEMHLGEECYVGLSRIEAELVNVCGLFRRRAVTARNHEVLFAYMKQAGLHELSERLRAAKLDLDSFSAVAALAFDRSQRSRGRLCLGDAAAAIPPFTGNGMAMAFQCAELALDPLLAYAANASDWREACRATHAALRGRFRVRLASAHALHPFLLRPQPQRWFAALSRARLIPFRPLYASLH
jgi:menaquinone-9 beta-reductase